MTMPTETDIRKHALEIRYVYDVLDEAFDRLKGMDLNLYGGNRAFETIKSMRQLVWEYIERVPSLPAIYAALADLQTIDARLAITEKIYPGQILEAKFIELGENESYNDFKFIVGAMLLRGWTLDKTREDADMGTVDYRFHHQSGALFTVYVRPGTSKHCRVEERQEMRSVVVKKIVCDGKDVGELPGASLVNPQLPKESGDGGAI